MKQEKILQKKREMDPLQKGLFPVFFLVLFYAIFHSQTFKEIFGVLFLNLYGIRYIIRKHQKKGVAFTGSIPRRRAEKRGETYDVAELLGKGGLVSQAVRKGIPLFGSVFGLFCIFLYFVYALDEYSVFSGPA